MPSSTEILDSSKTLAVVGLSPDALRDSHTVSRYLHEHGYSIIGVNPNAADSGDLDVPVYPSLSEIPESGRSEIDLVVIFRRPDAVPPILEECAALGLARVWLQLGVSSAASVSLAEELGLELVTDQCIRVVHSIHNR